MASKGSDMKLSFELQQITAKCNLWCQNSYLVRVLTYYSMRTTRCLLGAVLSNLNLILFVYVSAFYTKNELTGPTYSSIYE